MSNDWRDGFLFVGNHLALDFLNTRPVMSGQPVELLPDCPALARWLSAAGLITPANAAPLKRRWAAPRFAASLEGVWRIRESLRRVMLGMEAGHSPPAGFLKDLNRLLIEYPCVDQVARGESGLERRRRFAPELPEHAFAPLADAIAGLLTNASVSRIRKCKTCVLHFYDTSKKGRRLWCSMNLCGNRSKVAAFAGRQRG